MKACFFLANDAHFLSPAPNPFFYGGSFDQFDPTLGTLRSVTLSFSGSVIYSETFVPDLQFCGFTCGASGSWDTGFYIFSTPGFPNIPPGAGFPNFFAHAGGGFFKIFPDLSPVSSTVPVSFQGSPNSLDGYIGTGNISVRGSTIEDGTGCGLSSDFGIFATCSSQFDMVTTLTYTFDPIPEPDSLKLLVGMVFGLFLLRGYKLRNREV